MVMKPTTISAARFKAECLGLLDKVARTGKPLVITKRGRPVARVVPLEKARRTLEGSIRWQGDIVSPLNLEWDAS